MTEREFSIQVYAANGTEPKEMYDLIGFSSLLGYVANFRGGLCNYLFTPVRPDAPSNKQNAGKQP